MRKLVLGLIFGTIVALNTASARNVWRECGIGGMLFKKTGWAAISSNIIWDLGTTASSSNASSEDLCEGPTASTANFINETYANLEEEIAAGKGKHLSAMLNMLGCDSSSQNIVTDAIRADLATQLHSPNYSQRTKLQNAENLFNTAVNKAEAANCRSI